MSVQPAYSNLIVGNLIKSCGCAKLPFCFLQPNVSFVITTNLLRQKSENDDHERELRNVLYWNCLPIRSPNCDLYTKPAVTDSEIIKGKVQVVLVWDTLDLTWNGRFLSQSVELGLTQMSS